MVKMFWVAIMAGFGAGVFHVLSGPDHLAAVGPLSLGKGKAGWRTGLQWGLGHCSGVFLIGVLALLFREALPLESISSWAERIVGLTLIGVGAWGLCRALGRGSVEATRAAFVIGTLHGFAGSSHLLGVVPGLVFPETAQTCAYLLSFGAGTMAGVIGFSSLMALVPGRLYRATLATCSCIAAGIGAYWLVNGAF